MPNQNNHSPFNSHHLSLKLIQRCPACQSAFQRAQVSILMENEMAVLAHMSCLNCGANLIANVITMPQGLVGNAVLTDMTADEAGQLLIERGLTEDEFLNIYAFIHANQLLRKLHGQPGRENKD